MRFVLGNRLLTHAGGTEVHLLTIATALQGLGHEVALYAPELGPFADHLMRRGLDVSGELRELPSECDVVLAQDSIVVYDLLERYPRALQLFRVCGDSYDFQLPPQLDAAIDLIVALSDRYARVARACAANAPLLRLRVPIDTDRLMPAAPIRARPRRAVLLGNYPERDAAVRAAWEHEGLEVVRVGAAAQRYDVAAALGDADIVVAKSRAALDAMACGRAVYVYDALGGDGWVTPQSYAALEADNFAGQATDRVIGPDELERDLADYDPQMGVANRDLVAQHHGVRDHMVELLTVIAANRPRRRRAAPLRELARLTSLQWSWERRTQELIGERAWLIERVQGAELRASELVQRVAELERVVAAAREEREAAAAAAATAKAAHVEQLECELAEAHQRIAARAEESRAQLVAMRAENEASRAEIEATRAEIEAMRATRAWRLATRYWRWRRRRSGQGRSAIQRSVLRS